MRSILPAVAEQLFRDIEKTYQESSQSKKSVHTGVNIRADMYRSIIARSWWQQNVTNSLILLKTFQVNLGYFHKSAVII